MASQGPGIFKQILVLVCLSCVGAGLTYWLHAKRPVFSPEEVDEVKVEGQVTLKEIESKWGIDKVIWIDARSARFFQAGHIPGAVHVDGIERLSDIDPQILNKMVDGKLPTIVYCGFEDCKASKKLAEDLEARGFFNVHVLQGGYSRWMMRVQED